MCSRLGSELPIPLSVISEQNLIHFLDSTDTVSGDLECSSSDAPKSARNQDEVEIAYENEPKGPIVIFIYTHQLLGSIT